MGIILVVGIGMFLCVCGVIRFLEYLIELSDRRYIREHPDMVFRPRAILPAMPLPTKTKVRNPFIEDR